MNETGNLNSIQLQSGGGGQLLRIEPCTSLQEIMTSEHTPDLLIDSMQGWTTWQKRNSLTLLTALRSPGQTAALTAALLVSDVRVVVDDEEIGLQAFMKRSDRGRVTVQEVRVPLVKDRGWGMAMVNATPTDSSIVAAFAAVDYEGDKVREARVALIGVWRKAVKLTEATQMLAGKVLTQDSINSTVAAIEKEVNPRGNYMGSEAYRRAMAAVTARRALSACVKGAQVS